MLFSPRPGQFSYFSVYFPFARKRAMEGRAKANKKQTLVESRYEKCLVHPPRAKQAKRSDPKANNSWQSVLVLKAKNNQTSARFSLSEVDESVVLDCVSGIPG